MHFGRASQSRVAPRTLQMLKGLCGGRSSPPVEGTHEGGKKHYRYESLWREQNKGDHIMELCLLERVHADWLSGELGRSYSDEMVADEKSYRKGVTSGEDNQTTVEYYTYELRKEQTKAIIFSANRCFKLFNDGVFLLKVACHCQLGTDTELLNVHRGRVYRVVFIWLICLYITSHFTFHLRKYFIVNVIPQDHHDLFSLFKVFKKVICFQREEISILCFYSRMEKTYIFINKFLEDIPQFFLYLLCFWMNGGDYVLVFLPCVCYWVFYVVMTVFYHGPSCPLVGVMMRLFVSASLAE